MTATLAIAYISPNSSTKKVAEAIADQIYEGGSTATLTNLSNQEETQSLIRMMNSDDETLLFIGSPVYSNLAVQPVMTFIKELSPSPKSWAVPFVTYGIACSGLALWQMAAALTDRGFQVAGAAKIAALHSVMWRVNHPEGEGRPNSEDLGQVRGLTKTVHSRQTNGTLTPLALAELDYHPPELAAKFKAKMAQPWKGIPRTVDETICDECGECAQNCPADAITLNPTPEFSDACFHCLNCIRVCPKDAITPTPSIAALVEMIRNRVETINEQPKSQLFVADSPG